MTSSETRLGGFEDRVVFVTGADGGIGQALVRLLLDEGARVVATDLHTPEDRGDRLWRKPLDVADSAAVDRAVEAVADAWQAIDMGASVAGILATSIVLETSDAEWRRVFDVNTHGAFHLGRALGRQMQPRGRGSIVFVSSNAAGIPRHAMAAYAASKAAMTMFARCLGLELAPHGIRCNVVAPGSTLTPMQTGMWADDQGAARVIAGQPDIFKSGIPLGKLATPEDIAQSVLFLLSDRAGHITMADLYVDGGATLRG
ncbi:2,3-dihydro-2,3-dihydroxybenzoate dehydrogenase [Altererythrobacter xixiisoli]|uniref:2,3-dihydro-2,3-dihydroxybenzoate dehydrogenase n=1 Tax=Croceibacterium xixiisoli TaxID=1476466 RepID=A0A6I4TSD3_9SPHN|nr:2,3-dihydro-2,3-dihydroxybenzoate dehydrogenase [Croceibacterium xixiisoli]MXO97508.1 2,3-dihydro-2,3-dihydroxybenzoate dehydrogenase [Croceibacterium xixiisoli]